jgi:type IV pilus assembly protein PilA
MVNRQDRLETPGHPGGKGDGTMRNFRNRKGFTLIELMIVVAIIGILAAIAIPNFLRFQAKAKQSEARELLSSVYTAEVSYYAEQNAYSSLTTVGFTPASSPKVYKGIMGGLTFTPSGFSCMATGQLDSDNVIDTWKVYESSREPTNTINDVTSP